MKPLLNTLMVLSITFLGASFSFQDSNTILYGSDCGTSCSEHGCGNATDIQCAEITCVDGTKKHCTKSS
jgi:hypothetical protein